MRSEDLLEGSQVYKEEYHDQTEVDCLKQGQKSVKKTTTRTRDIKKKLCGGGVLRTLAIENQEYVNYAMPWRHMNYDCLEYGKQIRNRRKKNKKEKLLKTSFGENGERWAELFADYQMHLICVNEITDFSRFHTLLREFLQLLSCRENKVALNKLLSENPAFESIDEETAKAASVLLGVEMHMEKNEEKETYNMCKAFQDHWNDGREIGRSEGRNEGRSEGINALNGLFKQLKQEGRMDDLLRSIEDNEFRDRLLQEFHVTKCS